MQKNQSGRNLYGSGHPNVSKIVESQTGVNISSTLIVNELIINDINVSTLLQNLLTRIQELETVVNNQKQILNSLRGINS
jgi:hypothetical protein